MKMNNLTVRLLFAAGAIPTFLWALWFGGWPRWSLLGFVLVTAAWEASRLVRFKFPQSSRITECLLPAGVLLSALIGEGGPWAATGKWLPLECVAMLLALILTGFRERSREDAFVQSFSFDRGPSISARPGGRGRHKHYFPRSRRSFAAWDTGGMQAANGERHAIRSPDA